MSVQLIPKVAESNGSEFLYATSPTYDKALRSLLCEYHSNQALIKFVRCNLEYEMIEEKCSGPHVNILCKFSEKSEFIKFMTLYKSNELTEKLEEFLGSVGLPLELGVPCGSYGKKFQLEVKIDEKHLQLMPIYTPKVSW